MIYRAFCFASLLCNCHCEAWVISSGLPGFIVWLKGLEATCPLGKHSTEWSRCPWGSRMKVTLCEGGDDTVEKLPCQLNTGRAGSPRPLGLQPQAFVTLTPDPQPPGWEEGWREFLCCRAPSSRLPLPSVLCVEQRLFSSALQHWVWFRKNKLLHPLTPLPTRETPNIAPKSHSDLVPAHLSCFLSMAPLHILAHLQTGLLTPVLRLLNLVLSGSLSSLPQTAVLTILPHWNHTYTQNPVSILSLYESFPGPLSPGLPGWKEPHSNYSSSIHHALHLKPWPEFSANILLSPPNSLRSKEMHSSSLPPPDFLARFSCRVLSICCVAY